jgi:arylsulfatase A-like enzyme
MTAVVPRTRRPNLIIVGVDSLRADHMSLYGYDRLTTPHRDHLAAGGVVVEDHISPAIPTTPGYASMLSGRDCFGTGVVALRHNAPLAPEVATLAEVLRGSGYSSVCVGFSGNAAARGFDAYLEFEGWQAGADGRAHKARQLNEVTIPELRRLAARRDPFFLFLRHMDPHTPYLPPEPFERLFYSGDERDPANRSMDPVYDFAPFADYFRSWLPEGCSDRHYVDAQYDGAIAYLDASLQELFGVVDDLGISENTLVVLTSDHGETLYEHDCFYDHHGLYEPTIGVPLVFSWPGRLPEGRRVVGHSHAKDVFPTVIELLGVNDAPVTEGRSLVPRWQAGERASEAEWYLTEATWMRKHGWRTTEWKLIEALEPDFHAKPPVELYHLSEDPLELHDLAEVEKEVVDYLRARMNRHIGRRERETGRPNPISTALDWHGKGTGPFLTSEAAYEALHIGSSRTARAIQAPGR